MIFDIDNKEGDTDVQDRPFFTFTQQHLQQDRIFSDDNDSFLRLDIGSDSPIASESDGNVDITAIPLPPPASPPSPGTARPLKPISLLTRRPLLSFVQKSQPPKQSPSPKAELPPKPEPAQQPEPASEETQIPERPETPNSPPKVELPPLPTVVETEERRKAAEQVLLQIHQQTDSVLSHLRQAKVQFRSDQRRVGLVAIEAAETCAHLILLMKNKAFEERLEELDRKSQLVADLCKNISQLMNL